MARDLLELLEQQGELDPAEVDQIKKRQRRGNVSVPQALIGHGKLSQSIIYKALADANKLPFVELSKGGVTEEAVKKVSAKVAFHYKIMPISIEGGVLTLAFSEPPDVRQRENLRMLLSMRIRPAIAAPNDISHSAKKHYGLGADTVLAIRSDRATFSRFDDGGYDRDTAQDIELEEGDASITSLVNQILAEALEMKATDVHIEPFEDTVRLRYRIDGFLREIALPPGLRELHASIISRMKIMADLNIAEKRLPHDGRIKLVIAENEFDLRVSILPTRFGETLNLRILNRDNIFFDLERLGLEKEQYQLLLKLLDLPHGMILVTGPTGSGKTTTLYASLAKTDKDTRKVITVEDPVEYQLYGISQIQIHESIGLTFASCLRSILRHDPDIVLVGEMRDSETAEIGIRAALTGHLVLSTLHTNDSVGAINRLIDMGVEPFLVASSLSASLAQRLVRRICPYCKVPQTDIPDAVALEMGDALDCDADDVQAWIGEGCNECTGIGYVGRVAIYEFFLMDEDLRDMVSRHANTNELRSAGIRSGMHTLRDDGWRKVAKGDTSIEEVQRITTAAQLRY
ncbi:MAG TPA: general secretion pathway protein GspE [Lentisphaeria bacterium]|nr:general secretion pathway protein GspE [Lentisphaeria bacterium]